MDLNPYIERNNGNGHHPKRDRKITMSEYWWAWTIDSTTGRLIVLGWHSTESEAYQDGQAILARRGLDFEVVSLRTRDRRYAKDLINRIRLDRGDKIGDLMKPAKYKI